MRILGWEERVRVLGISERDALLAEVDELRQVVKGSNTGNEMSVECELSKRQVAALAKQVGITSGDPEHNESPIFAFAAALRSYRGGRHSRSFVSLPFSENYPSELQYDPFSPEHMALTLGLPWPATDGSDATVSPFDHPPSWKPAPLRPSIEMVEAGAQAIAAWESDSVWPESWGSEAARHRNDARKAYLAMIDACPDVDVTYEANRSISALQRLAFRSIMLAYFTDKEQLHAACDSLIHECRLLGIDTSAKAFEWLSLVCSSRADG
jgi:hypothetical protein